MTKITKKVLLSAVFGAIVLEVATFLFLLARQIFVGSIGTGWLTGTWLDTLQISNWFNLLIPPVLLIVAGLVVGLLSLVSVWTGGMSMSKMWEASDPPVIPAILSHAILIVGLALAGTSGYCNGFLAFVFYCGIFAVAAPITYLI